MPHIRLFGDQAIVSVAEIVPDVVESVPVTEPVPDDVPVVDAPVLSDHELGVPQDSAELASALASTKLPFDPSEHTVAEVLELLDECGDAEYRAVLAAEKAGKNRAGIVGK